MQGDPGTPGAQGDPGTSGAQGDPGTPGAQGDPGTPGAQGDPGTPGAQGDPGTPGAQGDPGTAGEPGPAGAPASIKLYVDVTVGDDSNDGSEDSPFASINHAIEQAGAYTMRVDVFVAAGTYDASVSSIIIQNAKISLWGGYNSGHWEQHDPATFQTIIKGGVGVSGLGNGATTIVIYPSAAGAVVDGFVIEPPDTSTYPNTLCTDNGGFCDLDGPIACRGANCCQGWACYGWTCIDAQGSPTLSHNTCFSDQAGNGRIGIWTRGGSAAMISDNTILLSGESTNLGALLSDTSSDTLLRNFIELEDPTGNSWSHFGVLAINPSKVRLDSNVIDTGNAVADGASGNVAGVGVQGSGTMIITNNTIRTGSGYQQNAAIGDFGDPLSSSVTYTIVNNVLSSAPNTQGGKDYCVRLLGTSTFGTGAFAGLDNNDMFACPDGTLVFQDEANPIDLSNINGNEDFAASGNISTDLYGDILFSNASTHNWRLASAMSWLFVGVTKGGVILSASGSLDADDVRRPQGFVGDLGWSMGAYQQND